MNNIDVVNIRKILKWRRQKPFFQTGGVFTSEELDKVTTEELENWLKGIENDHKLKFKTLVDTFFEKYSKEGDNIILLTCAYAPDRDVEDGGLPWKCIDYGGFGHEYNKLYYPVDVNEDDEMCMKMWEEILELSKHAGIETSEHFWDEENEMLNDMWYGVIGIMKDHKAVAFVIRDDGMLCDEDDIDDGENAILLDLDEQPE